MEFLTKNTFLANYISFCKGHNSLQSYPILMIFFSKYSGELITFFLFFEYITFVNCWGDNCEKLNFWQPFCFFWRPFWIFFFGAQTFFLISDPWRRFIPSRGYPLLKYFLNKKAHYSGTLQNRYCDKRHFRHLINIFVCFIFTFWRSVRLCNFLCYFCCIVVIFFFK